MYFYSFKCSISLQFRNLTRHRMLRSGCISWAPMKMKLMKLVRPVQSSSSHIRPIVSGYQNIFATLWIGVVIHPYLWVPKIHDYRFSIVTHSNYVRRGAVSVESDWTHVLFDGSCKKRNLPANNIVISTMLNWIVQYLNVAITYRFLVDLQEIDFFLGILLAIYLALDISNQTP